VKDYFVAMIRVFRCGDLEVKGFTDGILKTSLDFVLGMERAASEELVGGTDGGSLFIPVNNFLFQRDGATVLIDAGAGNTMQPTLGKLPANLKAAGIDPADVTHIVLTHMHPDHANGLVDAAGGAVYPNAEILVHAQELEFWMAESDGSESDAVKRTRARNKLNMQPYLERIRRIHDGEEVLGCVHRARPFAGPHLLAHRGGPRRIHRLGRPGAFLRDPDLAPEHRCEI
jgi:glyoxylase-like metal-dependent hydrolase (beta-lactamase superfamily II)